MSKKLKEVSVQDLRPVCEPALFHFTNTSELPTLTDMIGQERAVWATSFGIDIASPGYHIFALGPAGPGKAAMLPRVSINHSVPARLKELAEKVQAFSRDSNLPEPPKREGISL